MLEAVATARAARLQAAAATDAGRVRTSNEDRHVIDLEHGIFLVVDGVGGHAAGEVAAAIAVDVISQRLARRLGTPEQRVREAIALANNEIFRQARRSPEHAGMTCVLTLALVTDHSVTVGHVGDSRLYKLGPHGINKLTHDHSPIGEREDAGELSELDAMRHPRRNEVFRDVGSTFREPDDRDFIEIVETTLEPDAALLLCSDGLPDMLSSAAIERTIRAQAGDAAAVAEALIQAANDAGGKDNITVVYVEGADFAAALQHTARGSVSPAVGRRSGNVATTSSPAARSGEADRISAPGAVQPSRTTWLTAGVLLGLSAAFALSVLPPFDRYLTGPRARTLVVGLDSPDHFPSIAAALMAAAPGDVVQVEPGEYAEALVLTAGVDLVARVPGTVTLVATSGSSGWIGISVEGPGSRVAGIRLVGHPGAPMATGIRLSSLDALVDDVTVQGEVAIGMDIIGDGALSIRASRFDDVKGLPLRIGGSTRPEVRQNLFVRRAPMDRAKAIEIAGDAMPQVTANLFVGYPDPVQASASVSEHISDDNYVMRGAEHGR